jgi:hypothetical protein
MQTVNRADITDYYGLPLDAKGAKPETTPAAWELYDLRL